MLHIVIHTQPLRTGVTETLICVVFFTMQLTQPLRTGVTETLICVVFFTMQLTQPLRTGVTATLICVVFCTMQHTTVGLAHTRSHPQRRSHLRHHHPNTRRVGFNLDLNHTPIQCVWC